MLKLRFLPAFDCRFAPSIHASIHVTDEPPMALTCTGLLTVVPFDGEQMLTPPEAVGGAQVPPLPLTVKLTTFLSSTVLPCLPYTDMECEPVPRFRFVSTVFPLAEYNLPPSTHTSIKVTDEPPWAST